MKSYDASGEGLSASSARTQSRQRAEQNLLDEARRRCFPGAASTSESSA